MKYFHCIDLYNLHSTGNMFYVQFHKCFHLKSGTHFVTFAHCKFSAKGKDPFTVGLRC